MHVFRRYVAFSNLLPLAVSYVEILTAAKLFYLNKKKNWNVLESPFQATIPKRCILLWSESIAK